MKNPNLIRSSVLTLLLAMAALLALAAGSASAAIYVRQNNTTLLNVAGAWSPAVVPTSTDAAKWDNTDSGQLSTTLGGNVTWGQILFSNNVAGAVTIGNTASSTLTLNGLGSPAVGIDMSIANQNLAISDPITLGAGQTWFINSGRTLAVGYPIGGASTGLTLTGLGTLTLNPTTVNTFTGGLNLNSGSCTLDLSSMTTPTDLINNANVLTLGTSTGLTGSSLTLKGKGSAVTSQTFASTTLNQGKSAITLTQNSATSLTAALGAITRNAGATLNFVNTPSTSGIIATTSTANDASGILGTWASVNSGTSLQYASVNGSSQIISYAGATVTAQPANLSDVTSATGNYSFGATVGPTLTGNITANTLRCTAIPASTLTNGGFTTTFNGLMNASSTGLTISGTGNLVIGANKELVIWNNTTTLKLQANQIVDNGAGPSSLVCNNIGAGTVYVATSTNTYSGGTVVNGGTLQCQPVSAGKGTNMLGTGTVTVNNGQFLINNGAQTYTNNFVLNNSSASAGDNTLTFKGPVTLYGNNTMTPTYVSTKTIEFTNVLSGSGGLTANYNSGGGNSGTIILLDAANTYTGNTYINATTTYAAYLKLAASGSISNTPLISISANGIFDVSAITTFNLSSNTTLSAAGTSLPAYIKGASAGTVSLGSQPIILTYDGSHVPLTITNGTLSLNANPFTVNGTALIAGSYTIISQTSGSVTSSGPYPGVVGTAIPSGKIGYLTVSGGTVTLNVGTPTLTVSGFPSSKTAGVTDSITVTAEDPNNNPATAYTGTIQFTSTDGSAVLPANYTFVAADNGTHTFTGVALKTVAGGTKSITATDTGNGTITGTQSGITVTPATAATLTVSGFPASKTAGVADNVTVTAKDAYGNTATGYTGTVHFTSSDTAASLPSNYTFVSGDNGTHVFSVTLNTVSGPTVSITATDTVTGTITGTESGITVLANTSAASLQVTGFPSPQTAGTSGNVTVTAKDSGNNTVTSYTGTIHFTSTDGSAVLPSDYTFVSGDNGVHTFTGGVTLKTVAGGTKSITATDTSTSITGTQSGITVNPAGAASLTVAGFSSPQFVGTAGSVTVTAKDAYGNTATGYTGTIHFTSTDGSATLPANYSFVGGDSGIHTFNNGVTFATAGTQSITATDTVTGSITGTQSGITINVIPSSFYWTNTASGFWSDATQWTNNSGVVQAPATAGATNYVLNFNHAGTYTATHNLTAGFLVNQISFGGATVTLAGNAVALTNNGTTLPQLNQNSTVGITINNNLTLGTNTTVGGSGNGGVTLNGVISGGGSLTKTNSFTLYLSGSTSNTYAGGTIISAGTLYVNYNAGATLGSPGNVTIQSGATLQTDRLGLNGGNSGTLTLNGGTWNEVDGFGGGWAGPVIVNADSTFSSSFAQGLTGPISGAGGLICNGTGLGSLTLSGTNTYAGTNYVNGGKLVITYGYSLGTNTLVIASGAKVQLNDTNNSAYASSLILNGVVQTNGTYGSSSSAAVNQNNTYFAGPGILTVSGVTSGSGAPGNFAGISVSGTGLTLTVTNGTPNGVWTLLESTNVATPVSQWQTNCTGTYDVSGNLSTNIVNTVTNPTEFFILK